MEREKAVKLFKEVTSACKLAIDSIILSSSNNSDNYQLQIKSVPSYEDKIELQTIVERHKLEWKEENDTIVIYTPEINV